MFPHQMYSKIAKSFSNSRWYVWNMVKMFLVRQKCCSKGLEIGCGNGKNILFCPELDIIGLDNCPEFLEICREKGIKNVIEGECLNLPFQKDSFDYVLSVAVFHHLSDEDFVKAVNEMERVLKTEGEGIITVWSVENQVKKKFEDGINFVPYCNNGETVYRYCNIFTKNRIYNYVKHLKIKNFYNEFGNWVIEFTK